MAEQGAPEEPPQTRQSPPPEVPPSTTVVTDRPSFVGSIWIVAIVVLLAVVVVIWAFSRSNASDVTGDKVITNSADRVGNAADRVGGAAQAGGNAADKTPATTATAGGSDQSAVNAPQV
jgi:hypothetical protein